MERAEHSAGPCSSCGRERQWSALQVGGLPEVCRARPCRGWRRALVPRHAAPPGPPAPRPPLHAGADIQSPPAAHPAPPALVARGRAGAPRVQPLLAGARHIERGKDGLVGGVLARVPAWAGGGAGGGARCRTAGGACTAAARAFLLTVLEPCSRSQCRAVHTTLRLSCSSTASTNSPLTWPSCSPSRSRGRTPRGRRSAPSGWSSWPQSPGTGTGRRRRAGCGGRGGRAQRYAAVCV